MKSPITGKTMSIEKDERTLTFRKEVFQFVHHHYLCADSKETFTSTALDELNLTQVYNQYRTKYNLPFPEEIKEIRGKYGLSAVKMAEVLGFGVNSYRNYENGEVPSHSNGKLIQLVKDPKKFKELLEISEAFEGAALVKKMKMVDTLIQKEENNFSFSEIENYLLHKEHPSHPNEFSGYRQPNLERFSEMVVFFTEHLKPWKTKMNKLLFYADFLSFKRTCFSISGLRYRAITMGPIPNNYNSLFEYLTNKNEIEIEFKEFSDGAVGEQFKPALDRQFNSDCFTEGEIEVLNEVKKRFDKVNTKNIIELSHKEPAWVENNVDKKLISYHHAFDLRQI